MVGWATTDQALESTACEHADHRVSYTIVNCVRVFPGAGSLKQWLSHGKFYPFLHCTVGCLFSESQFGIDISSLDPYLLDQKYDELSIRSVLANPHFLPYSCVVGDSC